MTQLSDLVATTVINDNDLLLVRQSGEDKQVSVENSLVKKAIEIFNARVYDTAADLIAANPDIGTVVATTGYHSTNDGGGKKYYIRTRVGGYGQNNSVILPTGSDEKQAVPIDAVLDASHAGILPSVASQDNTKRFNDLAGQAFARGQKLINVPYDAEYLCTGELNNVYHVTYVGRGKIIGAVANNHYKRIYPIESLGEQVTINNANGTSFANFLAAVKRFKEGGAAPNVVFVGDSLTQGAHRAQDNFWFVKDIESKLKKTFGAINFYNRGIAGSAISQLDQVVQDSTAINAPYETPWNTVNGKVLRDYVTDLAPDLIIIAYGMNSGASGADSQAIVTARTNLKALNPNADIVWLTTPIRTTDLNVSFGGVPFGTYPKNEQSNTAGLVTRELAKSWGDYCIDVNRMSSIVHLGEDPVNFRMNRWAGQFKSLDNKFNNPQFVTIEGDSTWTVNLNSANTLASYEMFRNVAVEFEVDNSTVYNPDFRVSLRKDSENTGEMLFQFLPAEIRLIAYKASSGVQATWNIAPNGKKFRIEAIGTEVKLYVDDVLTAPDSGSTTGYYQSMFLAPVVVQPTSSSVLKLTNFIISGATRYDYAQHVPRLTPYEIFNVANGDGGNNLNHPNNLGEREMYSQPITEFVSYLSGLGVVDSITTELISIPGSSGTVRATRSGRMVLLAFEDFSFAANDGSTPIVTLSSLYTPAYTVTGALLRTTVNDQTKRAQVRASGQVFVSLGGTGAAPWSGHVTYMV